MITCSHNSKDYPTKNIGQEELENECKRAEAIVAVSDKIISGADLQFKAAKLVADHGAHVAGNLTMINREPMAAKPKLVKAAGTE